MSYQLKHRDAAENVRRLVCKQLEIARAIVRGEREIDDTPIHATRRHLKKARAALALLCHNVDAADFRRQDDTLRDIGRLISGLRDAEVRWQTVRELKPPPKNRGMYRELEKLMALELASFVSAFAGWQQQAAPLLESVRGAVGAWKLDDCTSKNLCSAVQRTYKRGRKLLDKAKAHPTPENFHKLRARAKTLFYQLRILRPIDPIVLLKLTDDLRALGDMLGRAHDLAFLEERLRPESGPEDWQLAGQQVVALSEARQTDLQKTASELADHFYAERPRDFGARIGGRLRDWETAKPARSDATS